jgi:hypothetical protein
MKSKLAQPGFLPERPAFPSISPLLDQGQNHKGASEQTSTLMPVAVGVKLASTYSLKIGAPAGIAI